MATTRYTNKNFLSKNTINLVMREDVQYNSKFLPLFVLIGIIAIAAFSKFGVADVLAKVSEAEAAKDVVLAELVATKEYTSNYDELYNEYLRYDSAAAIDDANATADCLDVIALIDAELAGTATVVSYQFSGYTIYVTLTDVELEVFDRITADVEARSDVEGMFLYQFSQDEYVAASVMITLVPDASDSVGGGE